MANVQITLLTPTIAAPEAFAPVLTRVLAAAPVSAVILSFEADDERELAKAAKQLVPLVQEAGAAALLHAPVDPRSVARIGADGAHYPLGHAALGEAIGTLRPRSIVGVGGLRTRHDAMEAGEMDIDYLMFGEPRADGFVPETEKTVERAEWWAAIFNTPAIACAADLTAVSAMVATGAEFLGLGPWLFATDDPAATLAEAHRLAVAAKTQG